MLGSFDQEKNLIFNQHNLEIKWWPVFTKKNMEIQSRTYQGDFINFFITEYFNYFRQRTWKG